MHTASLPSGTGTKRPGNSSAGRMMAGLEAKPKDSEFVAWLCKYKINA
jgi:hypothetical protein